MILESKENSVETGFSGFAERCPKGEKGPNQIQSGNGKGEREREKRS